MFLQRGHGGGLIERAHDNMFFTNLGSLGSAVSPKMAPKRGRYPRNQLDIANLGVFELICPAVRAANDDSERTANSPTVGRGDEVCLMTGQLAKTC